MSKEPENQSIGTETPIPQPNPPKKTFRDDTNFRQSTTAVCYLTHFST